MLCLSKLVFFSYASIVKGGIKFIASFILCPCWMLNVSFKPAPKSPTWIVVKVLNHVQEVTDNCRRLSSPTGLRHSIGWTLWHLSLNLLLTATYQWGYLTYLVRVAQIVPLHAYWCCKSRTTWTGSDRIRQFKSSELFMWPVLEGGYWLTGCMVLCSHLQCNKLMLCPLFLFYVTALW